MKIIQTIAAVLGLLQGAVLFGEEIVVNSGDDGILSSETCIPGFELHEPTVTAEHPGGTIPGTSWLHPDATNQHTTCSVYVATFVLPEGYGKPRLDMDTLVDDTLKVFLNENLFGEGGGFEFVHSFSTSSARFFQAGLNSVRFEAYSGFGAFGIDFSIRVTFTPGDASVDTDTDGVPDWWEVQSGTDSGRDDASFDPDQDGVSNLDEYRARTNPRKADSDHDGLQDGDEALLGTDPTVADSDGDGYSDEYEREFGSSPLSAVSVPARKVVELRSGVSDVVARTCGGGAFLSVVKVPKIEPWDLLPGSSWIQPNPLSSPLSCSTYKLAFSIPPDFQLPELELLLFVDGEATVRCNDRPLGKFGGFTQPPSVVKTKDRSYFVAGENLLEIEFRSDGGGDGVDFWGSVSYSQTNVMATPRCGYAPLFVEFGLDGLLALESAVWDFGDGATGAGLAPTHEYAAAGSYMIKVTAGLAGGGELSLDGGLLQVVAEAPHADFSVSSIPGASPLTLQLTDRSTGQITRHHWDFGDGMVSADPSPAHTFAQAGAYEVKLLVSGPCAGVPGNDASASRTVDVGILRKATLEQRGPSCVALVLESDVAITGGEIGIAYDPTLVVPVKVSAGADLPSGAEIHSDLHAEVNCDTASGVQAGLIAAWIHPLESGGGSTPPGRHQLLKVCFDPANGAPEDVCSALKFVTCLGVLAAPVRNVVTGPDGASIPVTTIDGDVCLGPELAFRRGDSTGDDSFDISDAIQVLRCLFLGEICPACSDAADANDDGLLNIADPVYLLLWRFLGGPAPAQPFNECGVDPTQDALDDCESYSPCAG